MWKPLFLVIGAGVLIGLAWPSSRPDADAARAVETGGPGQETVLQREHNGHFYAHAKINGEMARLLVDTGASFVALTIEDAERLRVPFDRNQFTYIGEGASGPVRGQYVTIDAIEVEGKKVADVRGAVLEGSDLSLLGQSFLSRVGEVYMQGDTMIIR